MILEGVSQQIVFIVMALGKKCALHMFICWTERQSRNREVPSGAAGDSVGRPIVF